MSGEHKLKEGDQIIYSVEADNRTNLLFFSDRCQVYKARAADFEDTKASNLGDFAASKLQVDEGESLRFMIALNEFSGYLLFFFANGKCAKIDASAYETKTNRKKLIKAYSDKSELVAVYHTIDDQLFRLTTTNGKILLLHSSMISAKSTKDSQGVQVMTLRKNHHLSAVVPSDGSEFVNAKRYLAKSIPAAGALLAAEDAGEQVSLL